MSTHRSHALTPAPQKLLGETGLAYMKPQSNPQEPPNCSTILKHNIWMCLGIALRVLKSKKSDMVHFKHVTRDHIWLPILRITATITDNINYVSSNSVKCVMKIIAFSVHLNIEVFLCSHLAGEK